MYDVQGSPTMYTSVPGYDLVHRSLVVHTARTHILAALAALVDSEWSKTVGLRVHHAGSCYY